MWSLPNLTSLHLAGNSFTGQLTIPPPTSEGTTASSTAAVGSTSISVFAQDRTSTSGGNSVGAADTVPCGITPTLKNLSLSHNRLTGSIPPELLKFTFTDLDLSYNKFLGHIDDLQYAMLKNESNVDEGSVGMTIDLRVNRLSGDVPSALETAYDINILTGNVFHCTDYSKLPHHDPAYHYYVCGSDELNQSMISFAALAVFIILGFLLGSAAYFVYKGHRQEVCKKIFALLTSLQKVVAYVVEYVKVVGIQLDPRVTPIHLTRPHADKFPHYLHFLSSLTLMRCIFLYIAAAIMMVCLPVYLLFYLMGGANSYEYSTHTDRYFFLHLYLSSFLKHLLSFDFKIFSQFLKAVL